jgi:NitT/TauT family transport system permease protein
VPTAVDPEVVTPAGTELPAPQKASMRKRLASNRWLPFYTTPLILITAIGLWELYVRVSDISRFILPSPVDVAAAFGEQITDSYVWQEHIWTTFQEVMMGLALAIVVGVGLGFIMGKYQLFDRVFRPFVVGTQVIPKVALIPLFILWFGFGSTSKVVTAALLAFFPLLVNTAFGVRSVPQSMHDLVTSLGGTRRERFLKAELPHTMAYILAGMELAVVQATIGAIVAEYLGGDRGLGRYAVNLQSQLQVDKLFGAILMMAIFGFLLYTTVTSLRRLLIPWHESTRQRT